jgi:aspartate/methionine/tyrosine aminotransferase
MFDRAKKLEKEGRDIIHLEIGRPDFNTPAHIVEAAVRALHEGKHHYSQNAGIAELRQAIVDKFAEDYAVDYDAGSEVVVTNGVAEGVYVAVHTLLNPGDQVLIPDPRWVNYDVVALTNMVEPVSYTLFEENKYLPDPEEIEEKINPRTRMIVLASPSNPTGSVSPKNILEEISLLAEKHDLLILSDEIYSKILYPPAEHFCMASIEGNKDRTIVLNGFSKFYSMTGWRLGYVLGPKKFIDPILRYHQYMLTSTNTFAQWGAVEALKGDQSPSLAMCAEFQKRRDYISEAVNNIPGFSCEKPDGAFYLFPSIKETGLDGFQMANKLLEEAGVATVAGECFGKKGARHIRLSYANSMENLKKAVERIIDSLI